MQIETESQLIEIKKTKEINKRVDDKQHMITFSNLNFLCIKIQI